MQPRLLPERHGAQASATLNLVVPLALPGHRHAHQGNLLDKSGQALRSFTAEQSAMRRR